MTVAENLVMARGDIPGVTRWRRERATLDAFMQRMPFRLPLDVCAAALLVSEDLNELLDLADRIAVMRDGRIVHDAANPGATAQEIGAQMIGTG